MTAISPPTRYLDHRTPPHLTTLVLLTGIAALNMSIFLPSLSAMTEYFGTDYAVMQLSISAYLATTAVLQLFIGPISDRFGRRKVVLGALIIFVAATLGALLATSVFWFLVFRMLQAVVASAMALSRAIVRDMVSQDEAASMIGYVTMGMAVVPLVGPMIGGALAEAFDWHAIFVFLTIAGAAVLTLCALDLGETVAEGGMPFRDQVRTYPELLRSPRFWGYALCSAFGSGAFFALLGGASFVASDLFGLSPFWSGFALGAPALGYAIGNYLTGRYSVRFGIDAMALAGSVVSFVALGGSLMLGLSGVEGPWFFFGACTFLGLGNGLMLPNATAGLISVRPHLAGTASGLGAAVMIGGGAALSQFAGAILSTETGTLPLQWLMLIVAGLALVSILFVMWRARRIA